MIAPPPHYSIVARAADAGLAIELRLITEWGERAETLSLYASSPAVFEAACQRAWGRLKTQLSHDRLQQYLEDERRNNPPTGEAVKEVGATV